MTGQIIAIEDLEGPFQEELQRIMKIIPEKDKDDKPLQRLVAFRLKLDGEAVTRDYLVKKIEEIIQCNYTGSLYEFLKDDLKEKECLAEEPDL
jgi:predicted nucleic acid-binding protein